ncbi:hypothetical protein KCV02_g15359, partial [Aureobasidium melanogenum]
MEHSSPSPSRAVSPRGSSNTNISPPREKRKLESFLTESGETWEFSRPVKKSRSSGPGSIASNTTTALGSPTRVQRPPFSATSPTRGKRSRDPSDQDTDAQSPSPKRQMTSVTDLGDHAAFLRRTSWLNSSRSRRKGAAASRSRSPSQGGLHGMFDAGFGVSQSAGSVESEGLSELPDYEGDEEVTVGQHAENNLDQLAPFQGPAMTLPPASHFQEGQESRLPVVTSIETGQATLTTGPVVWSSLDPRLASGSRSLSPVARYKLARADSSSSESHVDDPQLLRSKFGGFAQATATVQHRSEAQQQSAREPGNTSTSASSPGPVTAVDTAKAATTKSFDATLSPVKESSIKSVEAGKVQKASSQVRGLHSMKPSTSTVKRFSPARHSPTISPTLSQLPTMDEPSQQLLSELEKYVSDRRNWFAKQLKHERVNEEEVKPEDACAQSTDTSHNPPNISHNIPQPQPDASIPSTLTSTVVRAEEETHQIMAVRAAEGPNEDDIDLWRICLGELDNRMDIDGEDDLAVQPYSRDRIRKQRDEDIRKAKALGDARRKFEIQRNHFDEAPDSLPAVENQSEPDNEDLLYTDHLLASSDDRFHAEKLRLQAALEHWESRWPDPSTLPSEHWTQEAITFATNQA